MSKNGKLAEPDAFARHHDATAAKGLCWECETNRAHVERVKVNGRWERVESLWCLDCKMRLGFLGEVETVAGVQ